MTSTRLEFRIPISPTEGFFAQVRFFNFALRRLGPPYDEACLRVAVGDQCDIDNVRRCNAWSENFNVIWDRVPDDIFSQSGIWGTANSRLNTPPHDADVIILSDADTALLRDIDPVVAELMVDHPSVRGHMAHVPPPTDRTEAPDSRTPEFWPWMFDQFGAHWREPFYRYSMDADDTFPITPAYFNLGFVAMNRSALAILGRHIHKTELWIKEITQSHMRCQIAITLIAYREGIDIACLPAIYNAANDLGHLRIQNVHAADIRVLHYLRLDEIDRSVIFRADSIDSFLSQKLQNPANIELQKIATIYRETLR